MLKFLKKTFAPKPDRVVSPERASSPTRGEPNVQLPDKGQLFSWWASDNFGDEEGRRLYKGVLEVDRIVRSIQTHGDFVTARQSLLRIAMLFPDAGSLPCAPPEGMKETPSTLRWRELMALQYATSTQ